MKNGEMKKSAALDDRIERLAVNMAELIESIYKVGPLGMQDDVRWRGRRLLVDVAWLLRQSTPDEFDVVHERVLDRARVHLGATAPDSLESDGDNLEFAAATINVGGTTLGKSNCAGDLDGGMSSGGKATFPNGAYVEICGLSVNNQLVGGTVSGGWSCSW